LQGSALITIAADAGFQPARLFIWMFVTPDFFPASQLLHAIINRAVSLAHQRNPNLTDRRAPSPEKAQLRHTVFPEKFLCALKTLKFGISPGVISIKFSNVLAASLSGSSLKSLKTTSGLSAVNPDFKPFKGFTGTS